MKKPRRRGSTLKKEKKKRRGYKREDQRGKECEREVKIQKFH
jgi:hypothetical protein